MAYAESEGGGSTTTDGSPISFPAQFTPAMRSSEVRARFRNAVLDDDRSAGVRFSTAVGSLPQDTQYLVLRDFVHCIAERE